MVDDARRSPLAVYPTDPVAPKTGTGTTRLSAAMGSASAAGLLLLAVAAFEGKRNDPYADMVGKLTVCYGETRVAMQHYSDAQCSDMLANGLADFAGPVLQRNPELAGHEEQEAAATSLAYNIGVANYRGSTVAKLFSAGRWKDACNAFLAWSYAAHKQVPGLLRRRQSERAMCLKGLPA